MLANLVAIDPVHHVLFAKPMDLHHHKFMVKKQHGLNLQSLGMMQNLFTLDSTEMRDNDMPPEFAMSAVQIIQKNGLEVMTYSVTTEDDYVLGNFRIRAPGFVEGSPAVFLQHGLFDSSDCWIINNEKVAPAFQLARAGYDVYMGNNRGNYYSNKNLHLDPVTDDKEFHDYSFTKYGKYDLTAQVQKAIDMSGQEKVTFMGHSQGTTQMFYELSQNQDWINERVNLFVALAPIANMAHSELIKPVTNFLNTIW